MKRNQLLLVFLLLALGVNAQNWNFIKSNERYHFQHTDDDIPLNTIFADSTALVGTDSVLYLNRLFLPCDTCESCDTCELYVEYSDSLVRYYDNQPGFLQREIVFSQVSFTVVLKDPEQNIIKLPDTGIKEWWFNSMKKQKAVLDTITYEEVLGVQDSVATILIDGEPQIKIAKDLGLIQYFDYSLSGLENAELGETLPAWKDFYDFEVGDVFMYYTFNSLDGDGPRPLLGYVKKQVVSLNENDSTLLIEWERSEINWITEVDGPGWLYPNSTYMEHVNKKQFSELYPNKKIQIRKEVPYDFGGLNLFSFPRYIKEGEDVSMELGDGLKPLIDGCFFEVQEDELLYAGHSYLGIGQKFKQELGEVYSERSYYMNYFLDSLVGYVKGVDTVGIVYTNEEFEQMADWTDTTSINQSILQTLKISPNPSQGLLSFELGDYAQAQVKVYTLQGKQVEQFVIGNNEQKNLQHLNGGIYLITIEVPEGVKQIKWVRQRN